MADEKYQNLLVEQTKTNESVKSAHKRLDGVEQIVKEGSETVQEMVIAVKEIAIETREARKDINEVTSRVIEIEKAPTKRFDGVVDKIIYTVIAIIIGYLLMQIGIR